MAIGCGVLGRRKLSWDSRRRISHSSFYFPPIFFQDHTSLLILLFLFFIFSLNRLEGDRMRLGLHIFILIFKFSLFTKIYCFTFCFLAQSTTLLITLLPSATRCLKKLIWKYLETIVESIFNDCYGNDYRLQTKSDCPAQKANMNSKLLLG